MLSPFPVTASFPSTPMIPVEVTTMEVLRRPYAFDVGRIITWVPPGEVSKYVVPGTPVQVVWGMGDGGRDVLTGYVHAVRPLIEGTQQRTELLLTDAASVMTNTPGREYRNMAYSSAVREVLDDHRLYLEADFTPDVVPTIQQGSATDWDFLVTMAQASDFVLLADQTSVLFRSISKLWRERLENIQAAGTFSNVTTPDARLTSFKPDYSVVRTDATSDLSEAGQNFVITPLSWSTYFPYRATGTMMAPFGVRPFDLFRVSESNAERIWTVLKIKHVITADGYNGEITFGGDGQNFAGQRITTDLLSVTQAMAFNTKGADPSPVLRDYSSIFAATSVTQRGIDAKWESERLVAPNTEGVA